MGRKNRERKKVDERRPFLWSEKYEMLLKSSGRCAHCGKTISESNVTVEHIIPLSYGGTNDMDNLVALCPDCNAEKDNCIYEPKLYYKHLKKDCLKKIQSNFEKYLSDVNWFSLTNFYKCDEVPIDYYLFTNVKAVKTHIKLHKARNNYHKDDMKNLFDFIDRYNTEKGIDCHGDELEYTLGTFLKKGALYYVGTLPDVKMVIPVRIENVLIGRLEREHYILTFANPIYMNDTPTAACLAVNFMKEIVAEISELSDKCGVESFPVGFEFLVSNTWLQRFLQYTFESKEPGMQGIYADHANYRKRIEEEYGGKIPTNEFSNSLITAANGSFMYMDDIEGDAAIVLENENFTRWDRFVQKFCGTEDICDFSGLH